jgi:Xaa-Pro dipeptidase
MQMKIFSPSTIENRRKKLSDTLSPMLQNDDVVIVYCGDPIKKPGGLDQTYHFLPHPEYYWLTGIRRPYGITCFCKTEGWIDFLKPITDEEKLWEGSEGKIEGRNIDDFKIWLAEQNPNRLIFLGQEVSNKEPYAFQLEVKEAFNSVRRLKDQSEIDMIKKAAHAANAGYRRLKSYIQPGLSEKEIQTEYEYFALKAGSEKMPYETIVGTGTNSAVLHAIPSLRKTQSGELLLIDAGADIADYCVDITRTFAVDGKMNSQQQEIYELVLNAQTDSIGKSKAGVEWSEIHLNSARIIAEGLKKKNIFSSEVDSIIESGAISAFYPHGVGHMVGLRVRDVGQIIGLPPKPVAGINLRVNFKLQENFVMTVEPGVYFVKTILESKIYREKFKDHINWNEAEKWKSFGGIRIEDDILIRQGPPEVLTEMVEK